MTGYLIIADWDKDFHPIRINTKETEEEAQALVNKLVNELPDAKKAPNSFYVVNPEMDLDLIIVDPINKTISIDDTGATKRNALVEIHRLEAQISQRREREAILGIDDGWLANQDALIQIERNKL